MKIYFKKAIQLAFIACVFTANADANANTQVDFFRAVEVDAADTVSQLIGKGFDPNTLNDKAQHPLYLAMREGSEKVAAALLKAPGIRIDQVNAAGETPLMMAALKGRAAWARRLMEAGALVHRDGWAPLHYAAASPEASAPEIVALLLDQQAQINARSPNGTTALMMAARYGTDASVNALLKRGADARLRNERDLSAADFARLGGREKMAAALEALPK